MFKVQEWEPRHGTGLLHSLKQLLKTLDLPDISPNSMHVYLSSLCVGGNCCLAPRGLAAARQLGCTAGRGSALRWRPSSWHGPTASGGGVDKASGQSAGGRGAPAARRAPTPVGRGTARRRPRGAGVSGQGRQRRREEAVRRCVGVRWERRRRQAGGVDLGRRRWGRRPSTVGGRPWRRGQGVGVVNRASGRLAGGCSFTAGPNKNPVVESIFLR
jgi:hypothetical protein